MRNFLFYSLDRVAPNLESSLLPVTQFVNSEFELNQILNDDSKSFECCLLKFPIISQELIKSTKLLRLKKPLLPTFVWSDNLIVGDSEVRGALAKLTFSGLFTPETTLAELVEQIQQGKTKFKEIAPDAGDVDVLFNESVKTDEDFFPIFLKDLILGKISFFDVYIRLAKDRYIKLMNKGETIDLEQLRRYQEKGVERLFLLKIQQKKFLEFCDFLSVSVVNNQKVQPQVKFNQVMQFGDQILRSFELDGVNSENLRFGKEFLGRGIDLIKGMGPKSREKVESILDELKGYEHTTAVAILGGMIIRNLGYTSPDKINTISLAILLHDVGLLKLPEHLRKIHNERELSSADKEIYQTHPLLGYEMLSGLTEIPETVRQAVLHHHERRDRTGYPEKISGNSINFVAEIIGLCDEYLCFLALKPGNHSVFMRKLDEGFKLRFSPQLLKAFREVFKASPGLH